MAKKKRFKLGQLLQHVDGRIFIFLKYGPPKTVHVVEMDNFGEAVGLTVIEHRYLQIAKDFPETFKGINIL